MIRKPFVVFILVSLATCLLSQESFETSISTETGEIKGTLLIPETEHKLPVVLIIAGSGPTDRNGNNGMMRNNSLKMLAEGLAQNGIASLRYDKRGVAKSMAALIPEYDLRFEHFVADAKAWVDYLSEDDRFSEIIIAGHSEGSLIGMLAAQKEQVSKFISLAGAGTPAAETLRRQLMSQPPVVLEQSAPILNKLQKGETADTVPPMLFMLFRPSIQPYMISWFRINPQVEIAKLNKPVLVVQGTTDIQVEVLDANLLHKANTNSELKIVEGMNHIFKSVEMDRMKNLQAYNNPNLPLHTDLLPSIVGFIKN